MYDNHSRDRGFLETTPDRWQSSEQRNRIRVMLYETFNHLSRERQNFLILCQGTTLTQAQIGMVFGCSQKQVYQEIKRAKRNILKNLAEKMEISENAPQNSENLVRLKAIADEELLAQIPQFFSDRIDGIYQSLDGETQKSLAPAFFSRKDN
ncbi:MAG: hypothetical protein AB4290_09635 [Spirulina sp.]